MTREQRRKVLIDAIKEDLPQREKDIAIAAMEELFEITDSITSIAVTLEQIYHIYSQRT